MTRATSRVDGQPTGARHGGSARNDEVNTMTEKRLLAMVKPPKPIGAMSDEELEKFAARICVLMLRRINPTNYVPDDDRREYHEGNET